MNEQSLFEAIKYFGSQQELAKVLGVTQQAVNHWLNRDRKIPYLQALKIALYTEGYIEMDELSSEQKELTHILKHSAFSDCAPVIYLPVEKIISGDRRCPIYRGAWDIQSNSHSTILSRPILIDSNNHLIACECRLRAYLALNFKKVKAYRLSMVDVIQHDLHIRSLVNSFLLSERAAIGLFVEQWLGNRQGKRTDLKLPQNFAEVIGGVETRRLAARIAGFGNHWTYSQAKAVVQYGIPELIKAMDDGLLAISKARQIVNLSQKEQGFFMSVVNKILVNKVSAKRN